MLIGPRRQEPVEGTARPAGTYPASPDEYEQVRQARTRVERNQKRRDKAVADAAGRAAQRPEPHANVTDPDSGPMPTTKGWIQGYNAQLVVSHDQLIMAAQVTDQPGDVEQFAPMLRAADEGLAALNAGRQVEDRTTIGTVVLDAGYLSESNLSAPGSPDRLIAVGKRHALERAARQHARRAAH